MLTEKEFYFFQKLAQNFCKRQKRTEEDNKKIMKIFSEFKYFQKIKEEYPKFFEGILSSIVGKMKIKTIGKGKKIWNYNDPVKDLYILISGEVKIFRPPEIVLGEPLKSPIYKESATNLPENSPEKPDILTANIEEFSIFSSKYVKNTL